MHVCKVDIHEAGLQDNCPGCEDLASDPINRCDDRILSALVALATENDRLSKCRTNAEGIASAQVLTALERTGRLVEASPGGVEAYLRERWKFQCRIVGRPSPAGRIG